MDGYNHVNYATLDTAIHISQCPPKSYTAGLRLVSEATITPQSVQPQGEIPEEGREKNTRFNYSSITKQQWIKLNRIIKSNVKKVLTVYNMSRGMDHSIVSKGNK